MQKGAQAMAAAVLLIAALAVHSASTQASTQACVTAYGYISSRPDLSQFKLALDRSNLANMLDDPTFVGTVFAPNNLGLNMFFYQADRISGSIGVTVNDVSVPQLTSIVTYHLSSDLVPTANLTEGAIVNTMSGRAATVKVQNGLITLVADNGFIGLAPGISNLPDEYDVQSCGALVNIIGYPLVPQSVLPLVKAAPPPPAPPRCITPMTVLRGFPQLSMFVRALQLTGLDALMDNVDAVTTVFAPTNNAINLFLYTQVPKLNLEDISVAQLRSIFGYSIVSGAYTSSQLTDGTFMSTRVGSSLQVQVLGTLVTLKTDIGLDGAAPAVSSNPNDLDIAACGSYIHQILFPVIPAGVLPLYRQPPAPAPSPRLPFRSFGPYANLNETLKNVESLSSVAALLANETWFTGNDFIQRGASFGSFFMPSNDAVERFLASPLNNGSVPMSRILQYHIVLGDSRMSSDWKNGDKLATQAGGENILVLKQVVGSTIRLQGTRNPAPCTIVNANNRAGLGLVHIIDCVLVPNTGREDCIGLNWWC